MIGMAPSCSDQAGYVLEAGCALNAPNRRSHALEPAMINSAAPLILMHDNPAT